MRIAVVGSGYVGLVSGACLAEFGHDVVCVDLDESRITSLRAGVSPIYEPGLDDLIKRNSAAGRLHFTTSLENAIRGRDVAFIAVGTPPKPGTGEADLTFVEMAARQIIDAADGPLVIVNKSTVPVGTAKLVARIVSDLGREDLIEVASNPEFLREGSAISDFTHPDRIVVGCQSDRAVDVMREVYRPLFLKDTPMLFTDWPTAELIKYAANSFLATKVAFINELANLSEKVGADIQQIAKGIGLDKRIGDKFLNAGPGYGGSCFPKDTIALLSTAEKHHTHLSIVQATVSSNERRKLEMAHRIVEACGGDLNGKKIAVLGLTFKPNTDDMRDAPSLSILPELRRVGAEVVAYDPAGAKHALELMPQLKIAADPYTAARSAKAIVLLTEWNEFRALDLDRLISNMAEPVFVDLRNVYRPDQMKKAGFTYISIGRPS